MNGDTNGVDDIFVHDWQIGTTTRISVATGGVQATGTLYYPAISFNGRYVAFSSNANILVSGDTNANDDVIVRDTENNTTERISLATGGIQGINGGSYPPGISYNGRYVVFWSGAENLVIGDTNNKGDIFIHNRLSGVTRRNSMTYDGAESNGNSNDITDAFVYENDVVSLQVVSINLLDDTPTGTSQVRYLVIFSEDVMDVETGDFSLATLGLISNESVDSVSGMSTAYTMTFSTGNGGDLLRLDIPNNACILDLVDNPLDGLPYQDGEFFSK